MITKLKSLLLCCLLLLYSGQTKAQNEVEYYCRQYAMSVVDTMTINKLQCYESVATVVYVKNFVTITTDRLSITAKRLDGVFYSVYGDLYVFSDMRPEDGHRHVVLKPIRFNEKSTFREKVAIELSTKQLCK